MDRLAGPGNRHGHFGVGPDSAGPGPHHVDCPLSFWTGDWNGEIDLARATTGIDAAVGESFRDGRAEGGGDFLVRTGPCHCYLVRLRRLERGGYCGEDGENAKAKHRHRQDEAEQGAETAACGYKPFPVAAPPSGRRLSLHRGFHVSFFNS